MDTIKFRCSSCDHSMRVSAEKAGRRVRCTNCDEVVEVPDDDEPAGKKPAKKAAGKAAKEERVQASKAPEPAPAAPPAAAPPAGDEDDKKGYGLFVDPKEEAEKKKREAEEKKRAKEAAGKKPPPKLKRRKKTIYDIEEWRKVNTGLMFILIGIGILLLSFALNGAAVLIGVLEGPEYSTLVPKFLFAEKQPPPEIGQLPALTRVRFSIALLSGEDQFDLVSIFLIINQVLLLIMGAVFLVGYFIMGAVPARFGTKLQLKFLIAFGSVNMLFVLFLKLLPLVGAYDWNLTTLQIPEVAMTGSNVERLFPAHLHWMHSPFIEVFLTVLVQFLFYVELVMIAMFLWSVGMSLKEEGMEDSGKSLVEMALGCAFIFFAYQMMSLCGSSEVLLWLLRIFYMVWMGFFLGFLIRFGLTLMRTRQKLETLVTETEEVEEESGGVSKRQQRAAKTARRDDDDEDEEDDEDEDKYRDEDDEEEEDDED